MVQWGKPLQIIQNCTTLVLKPMVLGVSPIFGKLRLKQLDVHPQPDSPKSSGVVGGRPRFREFPSGGGVATSGSDTWLVDTNEQWN